MLIRRLARPMLATMFIVGGIDTLRNPTGKVQAVAPKINEGVDALPDQVTDNVPTDPDTLVKINGGVQLGGGLLLASGKFPRLASLALAGTLVPTTVASHAFWEETDPATKSAQKIHFFKNVSMLGGLLIAAVDTEGKPSLGWRSRRAAKRAGHAVTESIPFTGSNSSSAAESVSDAASKAADRGQDLAHRVATSDTTKRLAASGSDLAHKASVRATELAHVAADRGADLAEQARHRGAELAQVAADRGPELADRARARGAELAQVAADRGPELADRARSRGAELAQVAADRGPELADRARARGNKIAKEGKKQQRKARKRL